VGTKMCEQCHAEKDIELFRRVTNQYTGVHPMGICKECYKSNQEAQQQKQAAEWEAKRPERERFQRQREAHEKLEEASRRFKQEHGHSFEQEILEREQALEAWYLQQPDRQCIDCKHVLAASAFGYTRVRDIGVVYLSERPRQRCIDCHEEYQVRIRPRCQMCSAPTRVGDFLRTYNGHKLGGALNGIKVCCTTCISRFEALSEAEQLKLLRLAMIKAYGETAVIYALQYDDHFPCQHIGRTKLYTRRMAQYKRGWGKEIKHHFILQQLFGPLSLEYESRWMMHALKHHWPIDNFELFTGENFDLGRRQQARLTEAVQAFEPLTAPFEVVGPLIQKNFQGTLDAEIVNWYCSRYSPNAYPSENEMVQHLVLMERLHGLRL
jgi:hypothetical protein